MWPQIIFLIPRLTDLKNGVNIGPVEGGKPVR